MVNTIAEKGKIMPKLFSYKDLFTDDAVNGKYEFCHHCESVDPEDDREWFGWTGGNLHYLCNEKDFVLIGTQFLTIKFLRRERKERLS